MAKTSFTKPGATKPPAATAEPPAKPPTKAAPPAKPSKTPPTPLKKPASTPPPGVRSNATPPPKQLPAPGPEHEVVEEPTPPPAAPDEPPVRDEDEAALVPYTMMSAPLGQPVGEITPSDYDTPFLKLLQDTTPLRENNPGVFTAGDWVVQQGDEATIIWQEGWEPIELTILRYQKQYQHQTKYEGAGSGTFGKIYTTEAAAQAAGLIPFGGDDIGYVPIADALVLIKHPPYELVAPDFTEEYGDDKYAMAMWRISGTAYKFAARKIMGLQRTQFRGGLHLGSILLEGRLERGAVRTYWAPQLRLGSEIKMHDQGFIDFMTELAG